MGEHSGFVDERDPDPAEQPGAEGPIRTCDYVAWRLGVFDGAPECLLAWPEVRRERAVAACADYLRRYGPHFVAEYPPDDPDDWRKTARLRFPILDHPATPDDVREGRAVFSAAGEGEARVVKLASGLPVRARLIAVKDLRLNQAGQPNGSREGRLPDGWIWQAEEVFKGGRWERSYGFAGHATIARVAASEIEFSPDPSRRRTLSSGLSPRIELVDTSVRDFRPGQPIMVALRLFNARGTESAAPTEFVRAGSDGRPALRFGISLQLSEIPRGDDGVNVFRPPTIRQPSRMEHAVGFEEARLRPRRRGTSASVSDLGRTLSRCQRRK